MAQLLRMRARAAVLALAALMAAVGLVIVVAPGASAATGCQVTYRLNAWTGGFTATVGVSGGDAAAARLDRPVDLRRRPARSPRPGTRP